MCPDKDNKLKSASVKLTDCLLYRGYYFAAGKSSFQTYLTNCKINAFNVFECEKRSDGKLISADLDNYLVVDREGQLKCADKLSYGTKQLY